MTKPLNPKGLVNVIRTRGELGHDIPLLREHEVTWTAKQFRAAIETGLFGEDDPLELLFGFIYKKMPVGELHAQCLRMLNIYFVLKLRDRFYYQVQGPIALSEVSQPEPDYAIVTKKRYNKKPAIPLLRTSTLLLR